MKKIFFILGALALMGLTTACVETQQLNPNFDAKTNSVNTKFVLNVASGTTPTKQSSTTVQENSNFRGLENAKLISMVTGKTAGTATSDNPDLPNLAPYQGATLNAADFKTYELGTLYGASDITASANETSSSHRVIDLMLPIKTDAMLIYAKAIPSGTDAENGKVTMTFDKDAPENTTFDLVSILTATKKTALNESCALSAVVLNFICATAVDATTTTWTNGSGVTSTGTLPALTWQTLADNHAAGTAQDPLPEFLGEALDTLTTIHTGEYRAGSSAAIIRTVNDLYHVATVVYGTTPTNDNDLNAQRLAYQIQTNIATVFAVSGGDVTGFKSRTDMASVVATTDYTSATDEYLAGFPKCFGIPEGSALLTYDTTTKKFAYKTTANSLIGSSTMDPTHYMYPAELYYFCNSLLRTNDDPVAEADYPNGVSPWNTNAWTGWTGAKVESTTRSVAVKNNINYGVALLKSSVAYNGTELEDNRKTFYPTEEANTIDLNATANPFKLTGVLIGGQNHQLNWQYLAKANDAADWDYMIYDAAIPNSGVVPTATGEEVYTLVFDSYHSGAQADQQDVLVALEFQNLTNDFYGRDNLVPKNGTFYLVGKLDLGLDAGETPKEIAAWDNYYPVPPYTAQGASQRINRVFIQDFLTTATFKIGKDSLKSAFVSVPDLRSTQMTLGLSVDIKWQTGLSFDVLLGQ